MKGEGQSLVIPMTLGQMANYKVCPDETGKKSGPTWMSRQGSAGKWLGSMSYNPNISHVGEITH